MPADTPAKSVAAGPANADCAAPDVCRQSTDKPVKAALIVAHPPHILKLYGWVVEY